jgi:hypothetical protein
MESDSKRATPSESVLFQVYLKSENSPGGATHAEKLSDAKP